MNHWEEENSDGSFSILSVDSSETAELHKELSCSAGHFLTTEPFPFELEGLHDNSLGVTLLSNRVPLPVLTFSAVLSV